MGFCKSANDGARALGIESKEKFHLVVTLTKREHVHQEKSQSHVTLRIVTPIFALLLSNAYRP